MRVPRFVYFVKQQQNIRTFHFVQPKFFASLSKVVPCASYAIQKSACRLAYWQTMWGWRRGGESGMSAQSNGGDLPAHVLLLHLAFCHLYSQVSR